MTKIFFQKIQLIKLNNFFKTVKTDHFVAYGQIDVFLGQKKTSYVKNGESYEKNFFFQNVPFNYLNNFLSNGFA